MGVLEDCRLDFIKSVAKDINNEVPKQDFTVDGQTFQLRFYNGLKEFKVYTNNGSRSIYSTEVKDSLPDYVIDQASKRIGEYCDGIIHCSCCGDTFPVSEIEGYKRSYFAGVYCQDCWDRKYKELEAKETYD